MPFRVALISALAPNRSIGHADSLPWRLPRDLRFFKRMTSGHVVLMGRKTFESLGCRPLPKRVNIVLTRSKEYSQANVRIARDLDQAIQIAQKISNKERLFVIGGGSVYEQTYTLADELYLTQITPRDPSQPGLFDDEFYGDTFFPRIPKSNWDLCHLSRVYRAIDTWNPRPDPEIVNYYFRFFKYGRRSSCGCTQAEKKQVAKRLEHDRVSTYPI